MIKLGLQYRSNILLFAYIIINFKTMPPMRRMARRTARRTSRRQAAMYSNSYSDPSYNDAPPPQQAPVQYAQPAPAQPAADDPKVILANRLARGEITPEEYKAAMAALGY